MKERRESRTLAYSNYLTRIQSARDGLYSMAESNEWSDPSDIVIPILEDLEKLHDQLVIIGPPSVSQAAERVIDTLAHAGGVRDPGLPPIDEDIRQSIRDFVTAAGAALWDTGDDMDRSTG